MMGMKIYKTKSYLPDNIVPNSYFESYLETTDEWIYTRTGIKERRIEKQLTLFEMIEKCLAKFEKKDLESIDGVICSTMSGEYISPALSALVTKLINSKGIHVDINAACSGYVYGLYLADGLITAKKAKKILMISAEKMSNIIDFNDRGLAILFGDGVGASLLIDDKKKHVLHEHLVSEGSIDELYLKPGGFMQMKGQDVFKFAIKAISDCIDTTLHDKKIAIDEIDYFILHQANVRMIKSICRRYKLAQDKFIVDIDKYGNTSSASIPIILSENSLKKDDKILMIGFGAGLSYGSMLYEF